METSIEKKIGYLFRNIDLLNLALTHSSFGGDSQNNERLEYLGDAVLELSISEYLYGLGCYSEGQMTKLRASIVCSESLSIVASKLEIGHDLKMGRGEISSGGRKRKSNLANAFEAILGAVFLDSDYETAKSIVLRLLKNNIIAALEGTLNKDYKTALQERIQKNNDTTIEYVLLSSTGPEHEKHFMIGLNLDGKTVATGEGNSKKEAEQAAAKSYMIILGK